MPDNNENLFNEFPDVTESEWKSQIEKDLKGKDYNTLKWKPYEGFTIEPFYTRNDLDHLSYLTQESPGQFPFARGNNNQFNNWLISQHISENSIASSNKAALEAIRMGAQSIAFDCDSEGSSMINSEKDISELLSGIPLDKIKLNFKCGSRANDIIALLEKEAMKKNIDPRAIRGSVDLDPHSELLLTGSSDISYEGLGTILNELSAKLPSYKGITLHGELFGNSGATAIQELAFTLSSGVEYIHKLTSESLKAEQLAGQIRFSFSIGSNYFMEIAKLRAARLLWAVILDQYDMTGKSCVMDIVSNSSFWNLTAYDPYTNILRGTVAAMAATIGGSGSVNIAPLDSPYSAPTEFTRRMARNTQLLLKNESYIEMVADPSAGSYYIENLTDKIAQSAWELFLEVEQSGGFVESLKSGMIQSKIEESSKSKQKDIETGRLSILGTNRFPNLNETSSEITAGDNQDNNRSNNGITTLRPYRASEPFEQLRKATEDYKGNKSVFLLPLGNPAMRTARSGFSANFFGCGGFTIIDKGAFENLDEGIRAAKDSGAKIVVLCSSDREYPEIAPAICQALKSNSQDIKQDINIVVAGNPKEHIEELNNSGVDDFIHVRSNILETLKKYQKAVGIG